MRRRDFCLPAAVAAVVSCARKSSGPARVIQVGVGNYPGMSPLYLAIDRGYFRDAGLEVKPQNVNSGAQMTALTAAGRLDACMTFATPAMFNAIQKGSAMRMVLGRETVDPGCGDAGRLYARKAAFPQGTADVRLWSGKTIASGTRAGMGEMLLDLILRGAGLDPRKTPSPEMSNSEAAAAVASGAIDAMINGTNTAYNFASHPEIVREDAGAKIIAGVQISNLMFGPTLTVGDTSAGVAFVACYLHGLRDYLAGATPEFLKRLVESSGRDPAVLTECRTFCAPDGAIDLKSLGMVLGWAVERGYTEAGWQAEKFVDTRFWEKARQQSRSS